MPTVDFPEHGISVDFPDDMSRDEIQEAADRITGTGTLKEDQPPSLLQRARRSEIGRGLLGPTEAERAGGAMGIGLSDIAKTMLKFTTVPPQIAEPIRKLSDVEMGLERKIGIRPETQAVQKGVQELLLQTPLAPVPALQTPIGKAALGAFGAQYVAGLPESLKEIKGAIGRGDIPQALQQGTMEAGQAALLGLGTYEAARPLLPRARQVLIHQTPTSITRIETKVPYATKEREVEEGSQPEHTGVETQRIPAEAGGRNRPESAAGMEKKAQVSLTPTAQAIKSKLANLTNEQAEQLAGMTPTQANALVQDAVKRHQQLVNEGKAVGDQERLNAEDWASGLHWKAEQSRPTPLTPEQQAAEQARLAAELGQEEKGAVVSEEKPATAKTSITVEHIGWDQPWSEQPWRLITNEEAANPELLGQIATTDARIEGSTAPISQTHRLLVLQSKDPADPSVHIVSVYRSGRTGAMAVDPAQAEKGKPNRQLTTLLDRYKPLYSVLVDSPVKNFHQKFASLQDFYAQFGDEAIQRAGKEASYEPPQKETEPVATEEPTPGQLLPTGAELRQVFTVLKPIATKLSPEQLEVSLRQLGAKGKTTVGQRQLLSAIKKLTQHIIENDPNVPPTEAVVRAIDTLHEHAQNTDNPQAFAKSVLSRFGPAASEHVEFDYGEIGQGGETALESRHGTTTGLPPGVPDGGPNFPVELMAASHRLGTVITSKTNLPGQVEGRYRRATIANDDAIEVGNIKNQQTVTHEMGHDLDALIFPAAQLEDSQGSLATRAGGGSGKALQAELVPISELMRGKIQGSKGHQKYRKRATELVADFFSLYAHDPVRARQMAPQFAMGFEIALGKNPDAAETIRQLHAGNVRPVAPQAGQTPTGAPAGMPGKVPARPKAPPVPEDAAVRLASSESVKAKIHQLNAEQQRARIIAERGREDVPSKRDREDVGAFMEGVGNLEIPGDTRQAVIDRMTPAKEDLVKKLRFRLELLRQELNQYQRGTSQGEYLQHLNEYLPHFYTNSKSRVGQGAINRFIKESPNAKMRRLPTLKEAVDLGLTPISQDPTTLYEAYSNLNWKVAVNRLLLAELPTIKTAGGEPIVVPAAKNPGGWPVSNNPLIQRVYARSTPRGVVLWKGGAAIHPDAWPAVRQMLEAPTSGKIGEAWDALNSITRGAAFAFALFHDTTLRSASVGQQMQWYNPARGLFRFFERNPITGQLEWFRSTRGLGKELLKDEETVVDAALHGLKFAWTESESYQRNARNMLDKLAANLRQTPYLGKSAKLVRDVVRWRQEGLWRNTHDAYKIAAYEDLTAKALQNSPPNVDAKTVKENIASLLNDSFGGQEWQTKFWLSPQMRKIMGRLPLAPDWTLSTLRSVPFLSDAFSVTRGTLGRNLGRYSSRSQAPMEGWRGNIGRGRFWAAELTALAAATLAAQYAIYQAFGRKEKGDKPWVWENEMGQNRRVDATPLMRQLPWAKPDDPTRYYVNLGKRPEEILTWVVNPVQNVRSKMSRPLAEIFTQITGTEGDFKAQWKRDHESWVESIGSRAKSAGRELVPFSLSGNQFALSVPYRKGMTKYKAQEAYESAYELMAEPSKVRALLRGTPQDTDRLIDEISDAADRNGVPYELIRKKALSVVRGKYYDARFKALDKGDEAALEKAENALIRLGAGPTEMERSVRMKMALEPR